MTDTKHPRQCVETFITEADGGVYNPKPPPHGEGWYGSEWRLVGGSCCCLRNGQILHTLYWERGSLPCR